MSPRTLPEELRAGVAFDPFGVPSPSFVLDEALFRRNLSKLSGIESRTGARVLLALKGFAMWSVFDIARDYLSGVTCSSYAEAALGREYFGKEVHVYAPAYSQLDMAELLGMPESQQGAVIRSEDEWGEPLPDHLVFNSIHQFRRYRDLVLAHPRQGQPIEMALRINPEHREVETALYDPCAPGSRLGIRGTDLKSAALTEEEWRHLKGIHFHNLCQKNSDALERTLRAVEEQFADEICRVSWVNFGGGHHITRPDYDVEKLVELVDRFQQKWGKQVYLEPGEATALNAGFLVSEVLDIVASGVTEDGTPIKTAILDTSATAHMPDVLEMPYRPDIIGAGLPGEREFSYRLGGLTCLAGDVIGDWSFHQPLEVGDRLVFTDMAHYTMVKTTMFNGVRHPSIVRFTDPSPRGSGDRELLEVRRFGAADYRSRLS
ncbi:MAG: carboxynorspermidine decarboxylase [Polyangiaceae bacterium]|nr:carboxynorspermidine decarboxylase [Polyangiaceae bacterium]